MTDDFENAMMNVRLAFRLLYIYNKKMLDLMKYISSLINLRYEGGWPKFSKASPREGKGTLDNWAWDWLNMYYYEFHFADSNGCLFSIILQSDTGKWDSNVDKLSIDQYASAEDSKTRLVFICSKEFWNVDMLIESENWKRSSINEFEVCDSNNPNKKMICKAYDISNFRDEKGTRDVLRDYLQYIAKEGITSLKLGDPIGF